jgi:hypothetical protein
MRPTTRRLFSVAVLLFIASVVGGVLALIFQWPAQLTRTLEGGLSSPNVTVGDLLTEGTVTSLPLLPWVALTVSALLARSRRRWGTLAVGVPCLLGELFVFGGLGEAFASPTPYVPRAVLIAAGVVYGGLGLALVLTCLADLIDRMRTKRRPPRAR